MTTPMDVIRKGIEAVPVTRYALGVAGIVAAIAVISSFNLGWPVAVIGVVTMFVLMTVLVVSARLAGGDDPSLRMLGLTRTWAFTILIVSAATSMEEAERAPSHLFIISAAAGPMVCDNKQASTRPLPVAARFEGRFLSLGRRAVQPYSRKALRGHADAIGSWNG